MGPRTLRKERRAKTTTTTSTSLTRNQPQQPPPIDDEVEIVHERIVSIRRQLILRNSLARDSNQRVTRSARKRQRAAEAAAASDASASAYSDSANASTSPERDLEPTPPPTPPPAKLRKLTRNSPNIENEVEKVHVLLTRPRRSQRLNANASTTVASDVAATLLPETPPPPLETQESDEEDGEDSDIVIVGETKQMVYAHRRVDCPCKPIAKYEPFDSCPKCYCEICELPVSQCAEWEDHCKRQGLRVSKRKRKSTRILNLVSSKV